MTLRETCRLGGHDDWVTGANGRRSCRTCRNIRHLKRKRRKVSEGTWIDSSKRLGDRGPREETYTREELLRARGYNA